MGAVPNSDGLLIEDGGFAAARVAEIMDLVRHGNVSEALKLTASLAPGLLESNGGRDVLYQLKCQEFVELVRAGNANEALMFAHQELTPFGKQDAVRPFPRNPLPCLNFCMSRPVFSLLPVSDACLGGDRGWMIGGNGGGGGGGTGFDCAAGV